MSTISYWDVFHFFQTLKHRSMIFFHYFLMHFLKLLLIATIMLWCSKCSTAQQFSAKIILQLEVGQANIISLPSQENHEPILWPIEYVIYDFLLCEIFLKISDWSNFEPGNPSLSSVHFDNSIVECSNK